MSYMQRSLISKENTKKYEINMPLLNKKHRHIKTWAQVVKGKDKNPPLAEVEEVD